MTLIKKRTTGGLIPSFRNDLSDFFDVNRYFDSPMLEFPFMDKKLFSKVPAANILEKDNEFVVEMAAPGMNKKDFLVDIDNNMLEIKVEKEKESKDVNENYTRREYDYTSFYRAFDLPENVMAEKIKAEYKDGVLFVHLPKVKVEKKKDVKEIAVL